ncbi:sphingomyelin phosphodiesterase 4-like isoform X1 [Haliotis rufescens]|uniref:sphingomyelin phosphodiesterase 4-like isoform X1 n=1 Tax=Haliotis rufescens TaxID=6454 RepID=UPI00201E9F34|nr:sphingomyelin phosphodiesterase 4-like isoform X1 [Haliotis rufescens]
MAALGGSSVVLQVQATFSKGLPHRCRDLDDIIRTTSIKELRHALPYIIENMFGFGNESGWGIDKIDKHNHPQEFECLRRFLAPDSRLLNLIYRLQGEIYLSYEFPFKYLPAPTRQMIEEGLMPVFLVNKIQSQGLTGQTFLSLSAFEYFLFHLAYCLVNPAHSSPTWANLYDYLYPNIIDSYIGYYLPLDNKTIPPMPNVPSPVRSPVSHYTVPSSYNSHSVSPSTTPPRHRTRPSLFKSGFIAVQKPHVQGSPVLDHSEAETWRSETLLQVLAEFWLNQNPVDTEKTSFPHASFPMRYCRHSPAYQPDPFAYLFDSYMPSLNQVKMVRLLIKYLHFFTNSAPNVITSPYQTAIHPPMEEFKRTAVPQILQKKMYNFLGHAFERWPLDSSFRMVLETWLSYIQPWRYTEPNQYYQSKDPHRPDPTDLRDKRVDDRWCQFIEDNLLFYTVMFKHFLPRVFRLDLSSPQCAYMLYRVTKVLCLPNLAEMIFRGESWSYRATRMPMSDLGASYLSSDHLPPHLLPSLPPHLADLEAPGFQYVPLFGERMHSQIGELIHQLILAREATATQQATPKPRRRGFGAWLASIFFDSNRYSEINDTKKLLLHLNQSLKNLSEIFKITLPDDLQDMTLPADVSLQNSLLTEPTTPDCIETNHGPVLTEHGKYQVVNGLRKFDITYQGDPDLQPIRSFENATLVRILHQFCSFINCQFCGQINSLYCRQDLVGRMAQVYLAPPLRPHHMLKSPTSKTTAEALRQPRLSLRFLASYQTLIYLGILYIFLRLWLGAGPVEFLLINICVCLLYAFLKAVMRPRSVVPL